MTPPKAPSTKPHKKPSSKQSKSHKGPPPLKESAAEAIAHFLSTLDGEGCSELYDMVLHQVEEPLFRAVMEYTQQNQSSAATMLGLNRGTLRKKAQTAWPTVRTREAKTKTRRTQCARRHETDNQPKEAINHE